ncbi:hypothetical protein F5884DRAFT_808834 [Xylogone sp. PMI_703]|nr:hypothetical protein F5884DRAFT_808834 [Xylogone sp. PMI_703]
MVPSDWYGPLSLYGLDHLTQKLLLHPYLFHNVLPRALRAERFDHAKAIAAASQKTRSEKQSWLNGINAFLGGIPPAPLWAKKKEDLYMGSVEQNHSILARLLGHCLSKSYPGSESKSASSISIPSTTQEALMVITKEYGRANVESRSEAKLMPFFSLFEQLIFVSMMVVLVRCGLPEEEVDKKMASCFDAQEQKTLKRIRKGALWANRCIGSLMSTWGPRATEIFLLSKIYTLLVLSAC